MLSFPIRCSTGVDAQMMMFLLEASHPPPLTCAVMDGLIVGMAEMETFWKISGGKRGWPHGWIAGSLSFQ